MDIEQEEMQFLSFWAICREAHKIISSWTKIFTQITLALILPLSFIYLAHLDISDLLFSKIIHNEIVLDQTREGTPRYKKVSDILSSEWTTFWLFKAAYLTFLLIFSLLSTSAVVYTIASIYTAREVTFKRVMSVVPKVWKRLMVTFLCVFVVMFIYHLLAVVVFILCLFVIAPVSYVQILILFIIFGLLYFAGIVYMSVIWQLASVVSVLEDSYGFQAMIKSKALIKGKLWVAMFIFFILNASLLIILFAFKKLVVHGESLGTVIRAAYGLLCLSLLLILVLFGLVVQTVIYFVCKSYHHENIDKSMLSDHLEVYLGEYVPLKAKDVQLEQFSV